MKAAVYPFGQVVRGLRTQAGVTILKARELTQYQNYERWESGDTRVGPDHLHNIAVAFGVSDDLWLLVFAWLVDRFTPLPSEESVEFTGAHIRRHLDSLPRDIVDFGDHANLALAPMSHRDLALLAFTARYGKGYAKEGESLVLAPVERATVPDPEQAGVPVLYTTYGDARRDLGEYLARTMILGGLRQLGRKPQRQVDRYMLLLLAASCVWPDSRVGSARACTRRALAEELDDARATAAPRAAVDAIRVLGVEPAGPES